MATTQTTPAPTTPGAAPASAVVASGSSAKKKKPRILALPQRPASAKVMRFTQSIKDANTQDMLNAYIEAYKVEYGQPIDRNTIVEMMLREQLVKDKDFIRYYGTLDNTPDARQKRASDASQASDDTGE